jgi:hypothetical protein
MPKRPAVVLSQAPPVVGVVDDAGADAFGPTAQLIRHWLKLGVAICTRHVNEGLGWTASFRSQDRLSPATAGLAPGK